MSVVDLSPIVKTISVRRSAREAFALFTDEISAWWPMQSHTRAKTADGEMTVSVTIEPRIGGRVYETLSSGEERDWGEVVAFEPGALLTLKWRMGRSAGEATDVSVRFEALFDGACRVTLRHENWQRMGADAAKMREGYNSGWVSVFETSYGAFAGLA